VSAGPRRFASQLIGLGRRIQTPRANEVACTAVLAEVRQYLPTPAKFIVLRVLNLTLFRIATLGNWMRRLIVARLITAKRPGPLRLNRSVTFAATEIRFSDRLEITRPLKVEAVDLPRSFTGIHMGSAKYFCPSELEPTPQAPVDGMVHDLDRSRAAQCEFTLHFSTDSPPELSVDSAAQKEATNREFLKQ
jgi:hypothetical protein